MDPTLSCSPAATNALALAFLVIGGIVGVVMGSGWTRRSSRAELAEAVDEIWRLRHVIAARRPVGEVVGPWPAIVEGTIAQDEPER